MRRGGGSWASRVAVLARAAASKKAAGSRRSSSTAAAPPTPTTPTTTKRRRPAAAKEQPPPPTLDRRPCAVPDPAARAFHDARTFVVFSDLHLSPRTLPACLSSLRAVRDAARERRAGVLFLGDWWHLRGSLPVEPLNAVLRELATWKEDVVPGGLILLPGNHDQVDPRGRTHALTPIAAALGPQRAHCFDEPAVWRGAVWVPYRRDPAVVRAALREAAADEKEKVSAAFLHADVRGARVNAAWQARSGLDAEALFPTATGAGRSSPIRRVYSGHYHLPHDVEGLFPAASASASAGRRQASQPPTVTYIGSPYQVSRAEEGQRKRLLVLDAEDGWMVAEEIALDVGRRFWTVRRTGTGEAASASASTAAPTLEELLSARVIAADGAEKAPQHQGEAIEEVRLELPLRQPDAPPLVLRRGDCVRVELPPPEADARISSSDEDGVVTSFAAAERLLRASLSRAGVDLELVRAPPALTASGAGGNASSSSSSLSSSPLLAAAESRAAAELLDAYAEAKNLPLGVRAVAREVLEEAAGGAAAASERPPRVDLVLEEVVVEGYGPFGQSSGGRGEGGAMATTTEDGAGAAADGPVSYPLRQRGMRALTGRNEDDAGATSNGAGKSSLLSAILWAFKALGGGGGSSSTTANGASSGAAAAASASAAAATESARKRTAAEVVADGCRHARVVVRGALNGEPFELERVAVRPRGAGNGTARSPTPRPSSSAPTKAGTRLTLAGQDRTLEDSRATDRLVSSLFATPLMARSLLLGQEELLALLDSSDRAFKQALSALVDLEGWALAKACASRRLQSARREGDALAGQLATMRRVANESAQALAVEKQGAQAWEQARAAEVAALRQQAEARREELERGHVWPLLDASRELRRAAARAEAEVKAAVEQRARVLSVEENKGAAAATTAAEAEGTGGAAAAAAAAQADAARAAARREASRARLEGEARLRPALEAALARVSRAEAALAAGGLPRAASPTPQEEEQAAAAPWDDGGPAMATTQRSGDEGDANGDDPMAWHPSLLVREEAARLAAELATAERKHAALEGERAAELRRRDALARGLSELLAAAAAGGGGPPAPFALPSTPPPPRKAAPPVSAFGQRAPSPVRGRRSPSAAAHAATITTTTTTAAAAAGPRNPHPHDHHFFGGPDGETFAPACDRCGQTVDPEAASASLSRLDAQLDALSQRCDEAGRQAAELRALVEASQATLAREEARLLADARQELAEARSAASLLEREAQMLLQRERDSLARADEAWTAAVRQAAERERAAREAAERRRATVSELERRAAAWEAEAASLRSAADAAEAEARAAMAALSLDDDGQEEEGEGEAPTPPPQPAAAASSLAASVPARAAACRRAAASALDARAAAKRLSGDLSPHAASLAALEAQARAHADAAEAAARDSDAAKARVGVLRAVDRAFGRTGIPAFVLEGVLGELQRAAGGYLRALSDNGMALELSCASFASSPAPVADRRARAAGRRSGGGNGGGDDEQEDEEGDDDQASSLLLSGSSSSSKDAAIVKTVLVPAADGSGLPVARTVSQLSGGERKRAALALALAFAEVAASRGRFRCNALLLDEALEKLDDEGEARVLALLGGLLAAPEPAAGEGKGGGVGASSSSSASASSSSSSLAFDTVILADQAAAFATHALPAVDYVVKRGGRARLEVSAAA